jgi:hypothetical protein
MLRDELLDAYLAGQKGMVDPLRRPTKLPGSGILR